MEAGKDDKYEDTKSIGNSPIERQMYINKVVLDGNKQIYIVPYIAK